MALTLNGQLISSYVNNYLACKYNAVCSNGHFSIISNYAYNYINYWCDICKSKRCMYISSIIEISINNIICNKGIIPFELADKYFTMNKKPNEEYIEILRSNTQRIDALRCSEDDKERLIPINPSAYLEAIDFFDRSIISI